MKNKISTPIIDFLTEYGESDISRLHMPGHKGKAPKCRMPEGLSKAYAYDITEIKDADNLYAPSGIIAESERNASLIFGCRTFFCTEGSSLAIKAMLYLAYKHFEINNGPVGEKEKPYVITVGMCHKAFFHAVELLNIRVKRTECSTITLEENDVSGIISGIKEIISGEAQKPIGVYITYPDYFGSVVDLKGLKEALTALDIPLLTDGAHSAYFKFLDKEKYGEYLHPVECGSDISCTSAHKTLPALTGAAYLHVSDSFKDIFPIVRHSMDLFGSSSPSYLIMASLDAFNAAADEYAKETNEFSEKVDALKNDLKEMGFNVKKSDPLRITVLSDERFTGEHFAFSLRKHKCEPECYDKEYVIMMLSAHNGDKDLQRIKEAFLSLKTEAGNPSGEDNNGYNCLDNFI